MDTAGAKHCNLNSYYFAGHCGGSHVESASLKNTITYHTNCEIGAAKKFEILFHMYEQYKHKTQTGTDITLHDVMG